MTDRQLFGTDGIRGVANVYPMTPEVALRLGRAITHVAMRRTKKHGGHRQPRIVIGKDTRLSGYMLETAIAAGICAMGGRVMLCGPLPTPGVANIAVSMRADAGVVISASHNPYDDNGIKLFGHDGFKLDDALEHEIEGHRVADRPLQERPVGRGGPGERTELIGATGDDKLPLVDDPPDLGVGHEGFEGRPVGIRQRAAGERGGWRNQSVWSLPGGSAAARAATALVNPPVALSESSRGGVECRHRHTLNPLCPPPRIDESWEVKDLIL